MAARPGLSRRRLLGLTAAAAALAVTGCSREEPGTAGTGRRRIRYAADHSDQFGDLVLPAGDPKGLVILVHGGFWSSSYGLDLMEPLADDLAQHGFASWNIEYRRLGDGGGWTGTFDDVATAFDHAGGLRGLAYPISQGLPVLAVGHSAGGHLAAWAASRTSGTPGGPAELAAEHTFSLAGVLDLRRAAREGVGGTAVPQLLGGFPDEVPERYRQADPAQLEPRAITVVVAEDDRIVPASQATAYQEAQGRERVARLDVPGDHFSLIDPDSAAWREVRTAIKTAADDVRGLAYQ